MKSNLAGLYIRIEAKKRRINIINLWKVPKWSGQSSGSVDPSLVILRPAFLAGEGPMHLPAALMSPASA